DFDDLIDAFDSDTLADTFSNYTGSEDAVISANLRGVEVVVTYPDNGGDIVVFEVPSLGITEEFSEEDTRTANEDDLVDFLEADENNVLSQILNAFVAQTPTDPVAGNPNSLQGQMGASDFGIGSSVGTDNSFQASGGTATNAEGAPNLLGFGARFGRFSADGVDTTVITLPLNYTIPLADPRYAIIFDLPLTYAQTDDLDSYAASIGVGVRVPIFDNWYVTPSVRVGATGSLDLGSAAVLYSASVSSNFTVELGGLDWTLGNMVSYIATAPLDLPTGDFDAEYDLQNFVTRNGLEVSGGTGFELFGNPLTWELSAVNTQIFGDDVFIDNYTDVAFSLGTEASENRLAWDSLRLGVTYTFANEDYDGFRVNFGYKF
ncbi:MAG: hypothetical protein AAF281_08605, partial [Pseudomonadota bacterium]